MGATASQITGILIIYSTICSGADQRKYQSSASLTFERGIHRSPVGSPHKWPVTRKCIYLMTSWCLWLWLIISKASCYLNHAISEFFITKMTPRIILTEISCKFILFTLEIVGLVQWNLKMHFAAQLVIQWNPSIKATQDGGLSKEVACHEG